MSAPDDPDEPSEPEAPGPPAPPAPPGPPGSDESLIEAAAGSYRQHLPGPLRYHPAWHDLDEEGRRKAYELALGLRKLEAALDPEGLSTTARSVLSRIKRG